MPAFGPTFWTKCCLTVLMQDARRKTQDAKRRRVCGGGDDKVRQFVARIRGNVSNTKGNNGAPKKALT
jgi:hypothetical protein